MSAVVMKIVVFEAAPWTRVAWNKMAHDYEVKFVEELLTQTSVVGHTDADVISMDMSVLDAQILAKFSSLKLIATRSTGVDQIDLEYCKEG